MPILTTPDGAKYEVTPLGDNRYSIKFPDGSERVMRAPADSGMDGVANALAQSHLQRAKPPEAKAAIDRYISAVGTVGQKIADPENTGDISERVKTALIPGRAFYNTVANWNHMTPEERSVLLAAGSVALPSGFATGGLLRGGAGAAANLGRAVASDMADGAVVGGISGALNPPPGMGPWDAALTGALYGLGTGAVTGAGGQFIPRESPQAAALRRHGVEPTLGQSVDTSNIAGATIRRAEEAIGSIPLLGDAVTGARYRAQREWMDSTIDRTRPQGAAPYTGEVKERLSQADDALSVRYDAAAGYDMPINSAAFVGFDDSIGQAFFDPTRLISPANRDNYSDNIRALIQAHLRQDSNGDYYLPGDAVKLIESRVNEMRRDALASSSNKIENNAIASAYGDVLTGLRGARAQIAPGSAATYAEIDPLYRQLRIIEQASTSAPSQGGDFTPTQLLRSIKANTPNKREFARAPQPGSLREWGETGREVLSDTLPNSGTADRLMTSQAALGLGGLGAGMTGAPGAELAYLAPFAVLGGTRPGQQVLKSLAFFPGKLPGSWGTATSTALRGGVPNYLLGEDWRNAP